MSLNADPQVLAALVSQQLRQPICNGFGMVDNPADLQSDRAQEQAAASKYTPRSWPLGRLSRRKSLTSEWARCWAGMRPSPRVSGNRHAPTPRLSSTIPATPDQPRTGAHDCCPCLSDTPRSMRSTHTDKRSLKCRLAVLVKADSARPFASSVFIIQIRGSAPDPLGVPAWEPRRYCPVKRIARVSVENRPGRLRPGPSSHFAPTAGGV
jgi:hypothetical protein